MVSPGNRKMDKTTVLKSTISFLKQHKESAAKSNAYEIQKTWKPSFLSNKEFTDLMLEALEGFVLVFSVSDGAIVYASETITSLLGHLPREVISTSMYELVHEKDKTKLYHTLQSAEANCPSSVDDADEGEVNFYLHLKRSAHSQMRNIVLQNGEEDSLPHEQQQQEEEPYFELVRLSGYFQTWTMNSRSNNGNISGGGGNDSDDECSIKSGGGVSKAASTGVPDSDACTQVERKVFVCTVRLQTNQLLRELPIVSFAKDEFTSRYSLEWKFIYLDHRAPPIIGYLPFEVLGTSGYEYVHMDDLDRLAMCHERLMQTGEGTSCLHRFLTKGQQWIWLRTRYFITYHQWNSKPEFVVGTHHIVSYADVVKDLAKENGAETSGGGGGNASEAGSYEVRSHYATTDSPTWSSRSSMCGSSGTGSRVSQDQGSKMSFNYDSAENNSFFEAGNDSFELGMDIGGGGGGGGGNGSVGGSSNRSVHFPDSNPVPSSRKVSKSASSILQPDLKLAGPQGAGPSSSSQHSANMDEPFPSLLLGGSPNPRAVVASPSSTVVSNGTPRLQMTPAQIQLQEQLRTKHAELYRKIGEQQVELRRISEQLLMSQYGLVPVTVTFQQPAVTSGLMQPGIVSVAGQGQLVQQQGQLQGPQQQGGYVSRGLVQLSDGPSSSQNGNSNQRSQDEAAASGQMLQSEMLFGSIQARGQQQGRQQQQQTDQQQQMQQNNR